jgi:hypothetical protein
MKRKRARCRKRGPRPVPQITFGPGCPLANIARVRACFSDVEYGDREIEMYWTAQLRTVVASVAHERLIAKLRNQSEFTQMAYFGGENGAGSAKADGIGGLETFGLPRA